jgi:hypothetical protein
MTDDLLFNNCVVCPKCRKRVAVCTDLDGTWFFICKACGKESERFKKGDCPDDVCQICVRWKV